MPQALHIFRKDVRHFWGLIAVVVTIEVLTSGAASSISPGLALGQAMLSVIQALAQSFLIITIIHEEALPGDRQYWLTRPYSWRSLLLAKALFVAVFINLPVFATDAAALIARGQSPLAYLPSLLTAQLFTLLKLALPVAALAAATASLIQFVWTFLGIFAAFYVITFELSRHLRYDISWNSMEWLHTTTTAILVSACALAIVLVQYRRRDLRRARWLLAMLVIVLIFSLCVPGQHAAFALLTRFGPHSPAASQIRIHPDPEFLGSLTAIGRSGLGVTSIRLTGVPSGMSLYSADLYRAVDPKAFPRPDEHFLPGDGPYGLYGVYTPGVRTNISATLLSAPIVTPLGPRQAPWPVPDGGLCSVWTPTGDLLFVACSWPAHLPTLVSFRIHWLDTGDTVEALPFSTSPVNYAPYRAGFWQLTQLQTNLNKRPFEIALLTRRFVAHFERTVDIPPAGGPPIP